VEGFKKISPSIVKYEVTKPIFSKTSDTNDILILLNDEIRNYYDVTDVVFVAHGATSFSCAGAQAYIYINSFLERLHPRNYFSTIEGAFTFNKYNIYNEIYYHPDPKKILIVPMLLVTGEHSKNDIIEMKEGLKEFLPNVNVIENYNDEGYFSLLKVQKIREYFKKEILEAIEIINW
jgi:cobalamin biosynthesis Co2+ chelatase CbiK